MWPLAAAGWAALIAATSSTVVLPHDWFAWFGSHVFRTEGSQRAFVASWGASWFAIVKGWHATEFALLFVFVLAGLDRLRGEKTARNLITAAAVCLLFAASDEYHQTFVPGRGGTWTDVGIDSLGIGAMALAMQQRRRGKTREGLLGVRARMTVRSRFYVAGLLHGAAGAWIVGWAASHWVVGRSILFGPQGWLPVPLSLCLVFLGSRLIQTKPGAAGPGPTDSQSLSQSQPPSHSL